MEASAWVIEASIAAVMAVMGGLINRIYKSLDEIKSESQRRSTDLHKRIDRVSEDITGLKVCMARIDSALNGKAKK